MLTMNKTWFITGASRGFGRIWAEAALKRGDKVTATARKLADVADLKGRFGDPVLPLALDGTDPVYLLFATWNQPRWTLKLLPSSPLPHASPFYSQPCSTLFP